MKFPPSGLWNIVITKTRARALLTYNPRIWCLQHRSNEGHKNQDDTVSTEGRLRFTRLELPALIHVVKLNENHDEPSVTTDLRLRLISEHVTLVVLKQVLAYVLVRIIALAFAPRTEWCRYDPTSFCTAQQSTHTSKLTAIVYWLRYTPFIAKRRVLLRSLSNPMSTRLPFMCIKWQCSVVETVKRINILFSRQSLWRNSQSPSSKALSVGNICTFATPITYNGSVAKHRNRM